MSQLCEVVQIGRVGKIKQVGPNLLVSVASDASYKKDGEWIDRANWIEAYDLCLSRGPDDLGL